MLGDYFRRSWVVSVGVDQYRSGIPTLSAAVADARGVYDALTLDHGFNTFELPSPLLLMDRAATGPALIDLLNRLSKVVKADDRILFYFAGHGLSSRGPVASEPGYLLFQDAEAGRQESYLGMKALFAALRQLPCRHLLVVLDCCFAGELRYASTRLFDSEPERSDTPLAYEWFRFYAEGKACQLLASASDEPAADGFGPREEGIRDGHSPFTQALLSGLRGDAAGSIHPVITANRLIAWIEDQFAKWQVPQHPQLFDLEGQGNGRFLWVKPAVRNGFEPDSLPRLEQLHAQDDPWADPGSTADAEAALKELFTDQKIGAAPCKLEEAGRAAAVRAEVLVPARRAALVFDPPELADQIADECGSGPGVVDLARLICSRLFRAHLADGRLDRRLTDDLFGRLGGIAGICQARLGAVAAQAHASGCRRELGDILVRMLRVENPQVKRPGLLNRLRDRKLTSPSPAAFRLRQVTGRELEAPDAARAHRVRSALRLLLASRLATIDRPAPNRSVLAIVGGNWLDDGKTELVTVEEAFQRAQLQERLAGAIDLWHDNGLAWLPRHWLREALAVRRQSGCGWLSATESRFIGAACRQRWYRRAILGAFGVATLSVVPIVQGTANHMDLDGAKPARFVVRSGHPLLRGLSWPLRGGIRNDSGFTDADLEAADNGSFPLITYTSHDPDEILWRELAPHLRLRARVRCLAALGDWTGLVALMREAFVSGRTSRQMRRDFARVEQLLALAPVNEASLLRTELISPDLEWRQVILRAVRDAGPVRAGKLVPDLLSYLQQETDQGCRAAALEALGAIGHASAESVARVLARQLTAEPNPATMGAFEGIGLLSQGKCQVIVRCLRPLLSAPNEDVRLHALLAAEKLADDCLPSLASELKRQLTHAKRDIRQLAIQLLLRLGGDAARQGAGALLADAQRPRLGGEDNKFTAILLERAPPDLLAPEWKQIRLMAMDSPDPMLRTAATRSVLRLHSVLTQEVAGTVTQLFKRHVKALAAAPLGTLNQREMDLVNLIELIQDEGPVNLLLEPDFQGLIAGPYKEIRFAAATAFGHHARSNAKLRDVLLDALISQDPHVREAGAHGLAAIGPNLPDEITTPLLNALSDAFFAVRREVVLALGESRAGDARVVRELTALLKKADPREVGFAAASLTKVLSESPGAVRSNCFKLLGQVDDEQKLLFVISLAVTASRELFTLDELSRLRPFLRDPDRKVQLATEIALEDHFFTLAVLREDGQSPAEVLLSELGSDVSRVDVVHRRAVQRALARWYWLGSPARLGEPLDVTAGMEFPWVDRELELLGSAPYPPWLRLAALQVRLDNPGDAQVLRRHLFPANRRWHLIEHLVNNQRYGERED